jgi:benzil reductase ((S)-benzoin forming)
MMKFFITGTSSGIGRALAERALADGHWVTGFSRRHVIEHPNYKHVTIDLAKLNDYHTIGFECNKEVEAIVLVNNAGILGHVKPVAKLDPDRVDRSYRINVTAPTVMTHLFLDNLAEKSCKKIVINISSGAGSLPIKGWSTYCASKAAINMFTEVLALDHPEVRCYAIAPGIVDTEMQGEIRRLTKSDFPDVDRFVEYKKNDELASADTVAAKLMQVIHKPADYLAVCMSLRDVELDA